jgi:hypothetical protein
MDIDHFVHTLELMLLSKQSYAGLSAVERDRQRLADVIARTAVFMGEAGAPAAQAKLMSYYALLTDLDRGIDHPIFKARKRRGKPPPSSQQWLSRATVAIALDCYLRAKIPFKDAYNKIKQVPDIKRLVSTGSDLKKSVQNWRETLNAGSVDSRVANERWRAAQQIVAQSVAPDDASRKMLLCRHADYLLKVAAGEIALIVSLRDEVSLPKQT